MMEGIAAQVKIHHLDGILTALFVNVLKAKVFWAYRISHVNLHDKQINFSEISFIKWTYNSNTKLEFTFLILVISILNVHRSMPC